MKRLGLTLVLASTAAFAQVRASADTTAAVAPAAQAAPAAPAPDGPVRWAELTPDDRASLLDALRPKPLQQRLLEVSRRFLHTPYVNSPLGEGEGFDPDPLERYDAVDCLTFVEEAMAISLSRSDAEIPSLLRAVRYGSTVHYDDRNHLMEAQWLPNNIAKGFLRDVTRRYGGEDVVVAEKRLTRTSWQSPSSQALKLPRERQLVGRYPFPMIPIERVLARARQIPSGTVLVLIREDKPGKVTRITHLGFVVQKRKLTYLRHAARNGHARVVDEDLETFLTRNSKYQKWKVSGVALFEIHRPPARETVAGSTTP